MYIVSLLDYSPPARADGVSFTKAQIEEAPAMLGAWSVIDTLTLAAEVTPDPEHPEPRDLTTHLATLTEGWYRVVWIDGSGMASVPSAPVQNLSELAGGVRPTIADVASRLRARTKVLGGKEQGTFSASTRPTAAEVDDLIDDALDEVLGKVQTPEPGSDYERRVRGAVGLYTAILVELSYYPEQVKSGQSAAATYQALYASRIKALISEGETGKPQGEGGTGDAPADAAWAFPEDGGGLVGYQSRW